MARVNATNFAGVIQFPYATAAADLFKKEDVQTLALAVDLHTHAPGLGLPLAAGAIPNGSITSAMIQDGTIATADIAANAVQQQLAQYFAAPSFSTTTTGSWLATPVSVAATGSGGLLRIDCFTTLSHSAPGSIILATIGINGVTSLGGLAQITAPGAGYSVPVSFTFYQPMSAGANTYVLYLYNNNAGTLALSASVASLLSVTEQKR